MNHRENLLAAMRRQPCARVPFQFSLCDALLDQLQSRRGTRDFVAAFDMPMRYIELPPTQSPTDFAPYHTNRAQLSYIDEWGVGHQRGSVAHFTRFVSPMATFCTPHQVYWFPEPDVLADYRWEDVFQQVESAHAQGRAAVYFAVQVFEPAWYLRGMDNLLADFLCDEEMAAACMDRMTAIACEIAKKAASAGVDIIVFGDDVGTQRAMMMSMQTWTRWVKPAAAATIAAAKAVNPDVLALYHSDGAITPIIPGLIEIGVDILNPVQPECMDAAQLKALYGDRLSFWGAIGTQTTMPFGTPDEVRAAVARMIAVVGKGGGFTVAPTHLLEPEVPWENIEAFIDAVHRCGSY